MTTHALIALAFWTVFAAVGCLAMHRVRQAATPTPEPQPEVVNRLDWLPPVPLPRAVDATWLSVWPTWAPQEQIDRMFDDIVAIEGLDR